MGNRVKGRVKKKSIKAAISSTVGSKRKLSRFGKKQKKDHRGLEASFISRSRCLKILQLSIKDFRRLCILKGVYPRNPLKNKFPHKKKNQSFYHIKDVRSIAHEPILEKFRSFKSFMKKVRKASGRNELDEANRRHTILPKYTLHHIVKERYPRFVDALSDLDDCLTLCYLYATLPSGGDDTRTHPTPSSKFITKAKQLVSSWGAYCSTTNSITKTFISIKGIYMEATIQNTIIRWIIPHAFTQYIPDDVDFRIMNTFFELYQVMLDFILYKLYNDLSVRYPLLSFNDNNTNDIIQIPGQVGTTGTTGIMVGAHVRALRNALDNNTAGNIISSVVTQSQQQQLEETVITDTKRIGDTRTIDADKKNRIKSVSEVLKHVSRGNADETMDDNDDDDDDERNEDGTKVDIQGPLKAALNQLSVEENETNTNSITTAEDDDTNNDDNDERVQRKRLFHGLTFFMSREIPRGYIELVCLAYGAKAVGWETIGTTTNTNNDNNSLLVSNSPISIRDSTITHHIIDRPTIPDSYKTLPKSREYIQPQWIIDSANFLLLLPIEKYKIGVILPPHLSPWVKNDEEGYTPKYAQEIDNIKNGISIEELDDEEEVEDDDNALGNDEKVTADDDDDEVEEQEDDEEDVDDKHKLVEKNSKKRIHEDDAEIGTEEHKLAKSMMSRKATHLYNRMQYGLAQKKAQIDKLQERRNEIDNETKKNNKKKNVPTTTTSDIQSVTSTKNKKTKPIILIKEAVSSKDTNRNNKNDDDDDMDSDDEKIITNLGIDKEFLNSGKKAWKVDIIKGKEKIDNSGKTALKQRVERLKNERKKIESIYDSKTTTNNNNTNKKNNNTNSASIGSMKKKKNNTTNTSTSTNKKSSK